VIFNDNQTKASDGQKSSQITDTSYEPHKYTMKKKYKRGLSCHFSGYSAVEIGWTGDCAFTTTATFAIVISTYITVHL